MNTGYQSQQTNANKIGSFVIVGALVTWAIYTQGQLLLWSSLILSYGVRWAYSQVDIGYEYHNEGSGFGFRLYMEHSSEWGCQALGWSTKIAFPPTRNICLQASGHAWGPNEKAWDTSPWLRQDANFAWQRQCWSSSPRLQLPPVNENTRWDPRRKDSVPRKAKKPTEIWLMFQDL